jgi:1-acyl-sn-glycerol-3-phosphate acyltransferase
MCDLLERNRALVIFPEGAINNTESELLEFKKGTAYMANKSRKPVLPVYIGERKKWWESTPVVIGEPIDVAEISDKYSKGEGLDRASEYMRMTEARLAEYCTEICNARDKRRV